MKSYLYLFINTNKNYFFERFPFLKPLQKYYWIYLLFKSISIIPILYLLIYIFKQHTFVIVLLPFFILILNLFGIDNKKWVHYYRKDWLLSFPDDKKRFQEILLANLCIDFLLQDNILIFILFQAMYFDFWLLVSLYLSIIFLYIIVMSMQLVLLQAKLFLKKVYSWIIYCVSAAFTTYFCYILIKILLGFVTMIAQKQDLATETFMRIELYFKNVLSFLQHNHILILLFFTLIGIVNLFCISYSMEKGYFQNGKQDMQARTHDLWLIRKYINMIEYINCEYSHTLKKELALIVELYQFQYKEYFNTFLFDRSVYILCAILINIAENYSNKLEIIFIPVILVMFYMDINSGACSKLLANMSFISECSTLPLLKLSKLDLFHIIKLKCRLFALIRFPSLIVYILLSLFCFVRFSLSVELLLALLLMILLFWQILPELFFVNNIIYTRQDYTKLSKYVEEINIIIRNAKEFIAIELYYKFLTGWMVMTILLSLFLEGSPYIKWIFYTSLTVVAILLFVVRLIMRKIKTNIINAMRDGDYSVDLVKIFKK